MFLSIKKLNSLIIITLVIGISTISAMQNPAGTLDLQTRNRFTTLTPNLRNIDLFWNKLSLEDKLKLKEKRSVASPQTERKMLSDEEFQHTARTLYIQVMPLQYRALLYAQQWTTYGQEQLSKAQAEITSYAASFWTKKPELTQVGKVTVAPEQRTPLRAPQVKIPILSQAGKYKKQPTLQEVEATAVAVSEAEEASPFGPATPRQFLASIEWKHVPTLDENQRISLLSNDQTEVNVPKNILYLLPTLKDLAHDLSNIDSPISVPFDGATLAGIITITWRIRELFNHMIYYTKQKFNIVKTYQPDDIPLTIRHIVTPFFDTLSMEKRAQMLEAANFMQAPWLVNALAAEWVSQHIQSPQEEKNMISPDVLENTIKKYRVYLKYQIYNEFSVADVAFLRKKHSLISPTLTLPKMPRFSSNYLGGRNMDDYQDTQEGHFGNYLTLIQDTQEVFNFSYRASKVLLTSLTGFEFLDAHELENMVSWEVELPDDQDKNANEELRPAVTGIHILKPYTFLGCAHLKSITLTSTGIKEVKSRTFEGLPKLKFIALYNYTGDPYKLTKLGVRYFLALTNKISPEECERIRNEVGENVHVSCPRSFK